jgi:hypothetical protein
MFINGAEYSITASADLRRANLQDADLRGANLQDADLRRASLRDANLQGANLRDANLRGADLQGAYLQDADLRGASLLALSILPEGDIVGWKKCQNGVIVKLLIPADAKRSNATGRKCRAEYAKALWVDGIVARSSWDPEFEYRTGETVRPDTWCDDWTQECASGIHFFITRAEAEAY